jgi:hypothetical protein
MNGRYHLATIKPEIDKVGNVAFSADDVLFDWTKFEIPRGGCAIRSLNLIMPGTNAVAANGGLQMDLYFATSVSGVAPPTLGDTNTAMNVISATAAKPYIIAYHAVLGSEKEDSLDGMVGFNVLGKGAVTSATTQGDTALTILEGDPNYTGATAGYQTIWVAGVAQGAFDFGTGCDVAGAHSADDLTIVIDNVDADDVFAIGDTIIAFDADGSGETTIGDVTAVAADLITVDAAPNIIADDDEICNLNPIVIKLGLEY